MAYLTAQDTFVMEIDGVPHGVVKGTVLPDSSPLVRHDAANGGRLFKPLDTGEDAAPAKIAPAKAEPAKSAAPEAEPKAEPAPAKPAAKKGPS